MRCSLIRSETLEREDNIVITIIIIIITIIIIISRT
jgi:hypothetical protein